MLLRNATRYRTGSAAQRPGDRASYRNPRGPVVHGLRDRILSGLSLSGVLTKVVDGCAATRIAANASRVGQRRLDGSANGPLSARSARRLESDRPDAARN